MSRWASKPSKPLRHVFWNPYDEEDSCWMVPAGGLAQRCRRPRRYHPPECGVDLSPDDEPGHYICDEPVGDGFFPHHECGMHHASGVDCDHVALMRAVDDQLLSYAR